MAIRSCRRSPGSTRATCASLILAVVIVVVAIGAASVHAQSTLVRVLSESAEIRTGPGFAYRAIYVASLGETLPAIDRAPGGYWFRVTLPDGTSGFILGDEVLPLSVDPGPAAPPGIGERFVRAVFSPPPLVAAEVGLAFSAGLLGGEGMVLFRPSIVLAPHIGLEAFVGETVGDQANVVHYGLASNLYLWPRSPVTLFASLGAGGAWGRPKLDQPVPQGGHYLTANAGGGLLIALKKRITLRIDCRNHVIHDANYTRNLMEYSGGFAVLF